MLLSSHHFKKDEVLASSRSMRVDKYCKPRMEGTCEGAKGSDEDGGGVAVPKVNWLIVRHKVIAL